MFRLKYIMALILSLVICYAVLRGSLSSEMGEMEKFEKITHTCF